LLTVGIGLHHPTLPQGPWGPTWYTCPGWVGGPAIFLSFAFDRSKKLWGRSSLQLRLGCHYLCVHPTLSLLSWHWAFWFCVPRALPPSVTLHYAPTQYQWLRHFIESALTSVLDEKEMALCRLVVK